MQDKLDPIQYEAFRHRLFNILEEGRIAMRMVSGSPVVAEGGETICSFYTSEGTPTLTAAGVLLHCTGARDFVIRAIEMYEEDPGINDGDQLFFNDPYIGGQHLPDQIIIKPIFYQGQRIAWTGSFMHTAETGGVEPGGMPASATSIFHEGIRILGLKIVEAGKFRPEVFNTIVQQTRDPVLVGLDTKAKIAANNVCAREYLKLVEKYGLDFVHTSSQKIIRDSEAMSRARLRSLPDGTWQSRLYGDSDSLKEKPFEVCCTMTKEGDQITFDFTGSSPQNAGSINCTRSGAWGSLFVVLASQLFWNVPWNGGMIAPVEGVFPEGTVVNCRYPAACSTGVNTVGCMISQTANECIAKMLFAAGIYSDVNSSWMGGHGCPYFGGISQYGQVCGGVILDTFAGGIGATPTRDGVSCGGNMLNPTSNISDVEMLELNLPFLYLARRQATDSGGFGRFAGGMGGLSIYMVYGTDTMKFGFAGVGVKTPPGFGMFGGYPAGLLPQRYVLDSDIRERLGTSRHPVTFDETDLLPGKIVDVVPHSWPASPVKEYDIMLHNWAGGGGYGDPLDREPQRVRQDVEDEAISVETARDVYGVVLDPLSSAVDTSATDAKRKEIREGRLREGKLASEATRTAPIGVGADVSRICLLAAVRRTPDSSGEPQDGANAVRPGVGGGIRIHEYLEIAPSDDGSKVIRCRRCGHEFCDAGENYKQHALLRQRDLDGIKLRYLPSQPILVQYQEYICPGCATLLEVDNFCPELDKDNPIIWDIKVRCLG